MQHPIRKYLRNSSSHIDDHVLSQDTDFCKSMGYLVGQCVANFCNRATILQRCTITCDVSCNNFMVAKHSHPPSCNLKKPCTTFTIHTTLYDVRAIARATEMR